MSTGNWPRKTRPGTTLCACGAATAFFLGFLPLARAVEYTKHSNFQVVDSNGMSAYSGPIPLYLKGVVLNNPEDMLNGTPNYNSIPWDLGGQWQIFIQAVDGADWGGTCLWMGQNYGNLGFINDPADKYTNAQWTAQLLRLNYCGSETQPLRAGDLIEVYARGTLWYAGKRNVNEQHMANGPYQFDITMLQRGYGLPAPAQINLADVRDAANHEIFQATENSAQPHTALAYDQVSGGEKYQSQRVTLQNVRLKPGQAANWQLGGKVMLTDASGREFPLLLGLNPSLVQMTPPAGDFNVTGIFDQQSITSPTTMGIDGYQLWVMSPSDIVIVPEPSVWMMLALVGISWAAVRRRRAGPALSPG